MIAISHSGLWHCRSHLLFYHILFGLSYLFFPLYISFLFGLVSLFSFWTLITLFNLEFINLFMLSCALFWDIILGWYHKILGWKFIIIYFLTGRLRKNLFWTNKKFVYLNIITIFCPKLTSENIVLTTWKGFISFLFGFSVPFLLVFIYFSWV